MLNPQFAEDPFHYPDLNRKNEIIYRNHSLKL